MKKRLLSLILAGMLLIPTFVACADESTVSTDTTAAPAAGTTAAPALETTAAPTDADMLGFAKEDNKGRSFTILSNSVTDYEFRQEMTGDVVNDAVYEKDRKIEDYLGIKLNIILEQGGWPGRDTFNAKITQAVNANDATYDLVNNTVITTVKLATQGCYVEGEDLPNLNLEKPWWMADLYDRLAITDKLYCFLGDSSLTFYKDMSVLFFNKEIWEAQKPDVNFYTLVRNNEWTLDKFLELTSDMTRDLNGDGKYDADNDQMAYITERVPGATWQTSLNLQVVARTENGGMKFLGLTEKYNDAYTKMREFHELDGVISYNSIDDQSFISMKKFASGSGAMMCNFIYATEHIRDMESDYGIIPIPKYDANQEKYIAQLGTSTAALFVPISAPDYILTSKVMESLAYFGYTYVSPKYYEVALKTKYASDPDMQEMLDIIRDGATFDAVFCYNQMVSEAPIRYFRFTAGDGGIYESLASVFAMKGKVFDKSMQKLVEAFEALG